MNKTKLLSLLFGAVLAVGAWAQDKLIYSGTVTSPYSPNTTATLEIWGWAGDKATERVNYTFLGASNESNTVRIDFGSTLNFKWTFSGLSAPPTVRKVYENLTGVDVAALPSTPIGYTAYMTLMNYTNGSASGPAPLDIQTSPVSASWNMGSPWASVSSGVWWGKFQVVSQPDGMFTYDSTLGAPRLSNYMRSKTINLQLVKSIPLKVHLNQPSSNGSVVSTVMTSPSGPTAALASWKALNLWDNGTLQPQSTLTLGMSSTSNGVRTETVSWNQVSGHQYQLQVVDAVGNAESVWYPRQTYRFESAGKVTATAGGATHTLGLMADGTVKAWGFNLFGELGNSATAGSVSPNPIPITIPTLSGVIAIQAGSNHSLALLSDGTVKVWGYNGRGQLGNSTNSGTTTPNPIPTTIVGLSGVIAIEAGYDHSLALMSDGTVKAWGSNQFGQLGTSTNSGTTTPNPVPTTIAGLSGVVAIEAGGHHSLALLADGTVKAWGENYFGQLGNSTNIGANTPNLVPTAIAGLSGVVAIEAGGSHSLALLANGTVKAWGYNVFGQLGNSTNTSTATPTPVPTTIPGLSGVVAIEAGALHSLALLADGTVKAWGSNINSELGNATNTGSATPNPIPTTIAGLSDVVAIQSGQTHSLAMTADGTVRAWGNNSYGQIGNSSTTNTSNPASVLGWTDRRPISTGANHSLSLNADGTVWAWGKNGSGQLGDGTTRDTLVPTQVSGLTDVISVAAGSFFSLALKSDGSIWAWGEDSNGELGNGASLVDSPLPVPVLNFGKVVAISAQGALAMALKSDGTVWTWGSNSDGKLGNGNASNGAFPTPAAIAGLSGIVSIAAGATNGIALRHDGTVWAWGWGQFGQLGNGSMNTSRTPGQVSGLSNVAAVAAGSVHFLALRSDGSVWSWGNNGNGELGNGTTTSALVPVQITGLSGASVAAIAAGGSHSMALKSDGTVWAWGSNSALQFGNQSTTGSLVPIQALAASGISLLVASSNHSLSLGVDNRVRAWGERGLGGNGKDAWIYGPAAVSLPSLQYDNSSPSIVVNASAMAWTNQPITLTATAFDSETDIDETSVAYDVGGGWVAGNQVTLSANGTTKFKAADLAGHTTTVTWNVSGIDVVPPGLPTITPSPTTWATSVVLTGSATDSGGSAIDSSSWEYKIGAGLWQLGNGLTVTQNALVSFRVRDNAGNLSPEASYLVNTIDTTLPSLKAAAPPFVNASNTFAISSVALSDAESGLNTGSAAYQFDGGPSTSFTVTSTSISVPTAKVSLLANGPHTLRLSVSDVAGNVGSLDLPFFVDRIAPTITATAPPYIDAIATVLEVTSITLSDSGSLLDDASAKYWFEGLAKTSFDTDEISLSPSTSSPLLANGNHVLHLSVLDKAGNLGTLDLNFMVDRTKPSTPTITSSTSAWSTSVILTAVSTDARSGINASTWEHRLGTGGAWVAGNPLTATANGDYYFQVKDNAGNLSSTSAKVTVANVDTAPPVFSIVTHPAYVNASQTWTASGVTFSDTQTALRGDYWFDTPTAPATPPTFTVSNGTLVLSSLGLTAGAHTLYLRAVDAVGNSTPLGPYALTVDLVNPVVSAAAPSTVNAAAGALAVTGLAFTDAAPSSGINTTSGVFWVDSDSTTSVATTSSTLSIPTTGLADGSHTAHIRISDQAGNTFTKDLTFTLDKSNPIVSGSVPSAVTTNLPVSNLSFTDTGTGLNTTSATYWIDTGAPIGLATTTTGFSIGITALSQGSHTLHIKAFDLAGNTFTLDLEFFRDSVNPSVAAAAPAVVGAGAVLAVSGLSLTDPAPSSGLSAATAIFWVDSGTTTIYSTSASTISIPVSGLNDGSHTAHLQIKDNAGNTFTQDLIFFLDRANPALAATAPAYVNGSSLAVTALTITDPSPSSQINTASGIFWVDSGSTTNYATTATALTIPVAAGLSEGDHFAHIQVKDNAGNTFTKHLTFKKDTVGPSVNASAPAYAKLGDTDLPVSGIGFSDLTSGVSPSSATYWIDDRAPTVLAITATSQLMPLGGLSDGAHTAHIRVFDLAGNSTTRDLPFTIDTASPSIAWASGQDEAQAYSAGPFTVKIDALELGAAIFPSILISPSGGASTEVTIVGKQYTVVVTPAASYTTPSNVTLSFRFSDLAGNLSPELTKPIRFDRAAPTSPVLAVFEGTRAVTSADYLTGAPASATALSQDDSPLQYRFALQTLSGAPSATAAWPGSEWSADTLNFTLPANLSELRYLYVQSRDGAGNLSAVVERVLRVDSSQPAAPGIVSTTHPLALAVTDAVSLRTALFRLSAGNTGAMGFQNFQWKLFHGVGAPDPSLNSPNFLDGGETGGPLSIKLDDDNNPNEYYWLFARVMGANGRAGVWKAYPFRVDTTPPVNLTLTSSTHPLSETWYGNATIQFEWKQPLELTGVRSYYYHVEQLSRDQSWTPPTPEEFENSWSGNYWTATGENSLSVTGNTAPGRSSMGKIAVSLAAQDWAGNKRYDTMVVQYDAVKPLPFTNLSVTTSGRSAQLHWSSPPSDEISAFGTGLKVGTLLKGYDGHQWVELTHWAYVPNLDDPFVFDGLSLDQNYIVVVAVEDIAGNRVETPVGFSLGTPPQLPPDFNLTYSEIWNGWNVSGETSFSGATGTPFAQTGFLKISGTPLSTATGTLPLNAAELAAVPASLANASMPYFWNSTGVQGAGTGLTITPANGLSLSNLTLTNPFTNGAITYASALVGSAPQYWLNSTATSFAPQTWTTDEGWSLSKVSGLALKSSGWQIAGRPELVPPGLSYSASQALAPWSAKALTLSSASGYGKALASAKVEDEDFYLQTGQSLIFVRHAAVAEGRLVISEGYLQVQGLGATALKIEDLEIDTQGQLLRGRRFKSTLTESLVTPFGMLSAATNAVEVIGNRFVLTQAVLTANGSTITLSQLVLEKDGLLPGVGTIQGGFSGTFRGFPVTATSSRYGNGTRIFDTAVVTLAGFGDVQIEVQNLAVSLASNTIVTPGMHTSAFSLPTAYSNTGVTALDFVLADDGARASLTAVLPDVLFRNTDHLLSLGTRTLEAGGIIGAQVPTQTYPGLKMGTLSLTPTTVSFSQAGLVFDSLTVDLPTPFAKSSVVMAGWVLQRLGSGSFTQTAATAVESLSATLGSWSISFPSLKLSDEGLSDSPAFVLPPALGAGTVSLGRVSSPTGVFTLPMTGTVPLSMSLNGRPLSVPANNLTLSSNQVDITAATYTKTGGSLLPLSNLVALAGAASATGAAGSYTGTYSGYPVQAIASTFSGTKRTLTGVTATLSGFDATVALNPLTILLDTDAIDTPTAATSSTVTLKVGYSPPAGYAVQASGFVLSSTGLSAVLSTALPSAFSPASLSIGTRPLAASGAVLAPSSAPTYSAISTNGFVFTPSVISVSAQGLSFDQLSLTLPAGKFTVATTPFSGLSIAGDGSILSKGTTAAPLTANLGPWSFTFPTMLFSPLGLEGQPTLTLPPALGSTPLVLSSTTISSAGVYSPAPVSTMSLVATLDARPLTLAAGSLSVEASQIKISQASLTRSDGTSLVLRNLIVAPGATVFSGGSVDGTFSRNYFGFNLSASSSAISGSQRVLTAPVLTLSGFKASATLGNVRVSLGDDSIVTPNSTSSTVSLDTPYGAGLQANDLVLSAAGLKASLSVQLPPSLGAEALPLGTRDLSFDGVSGVVGPAAQSYPQLTYRGYSLKPASVSITAGGLLIDQVTATLAAPFDAFDGRFMGWTIKGNGSIVTPGVADGPITARLGPWPVSFPALRIGSSTGLEGEPVIDLPPALGSGTMPLGTAVVNKDTSYTIQPVEVSQPIELFGWTASASTLSLSGSNYLLGGVSIPLPGIFQSSDLAIGPVQVDQNGELQLSGNGGLFSFRGTNGFRVDGTNARIAAQGIVMGGKVYLPESMGGGAIVYPDGAIVLEPDGAVIADSPVSAPSIQFQGWTMTTSGVTVDRRGMTVRAATVTPLGLLPITLPDFTVYSTGELAVGGESLSSGSFPLAGGSVTVSYSGIRFLDDGLHLSASVSLPKSWGVQTLDLSDLVVTPQGRISASTALRNLDYAFDKIGLDAHFDEVRLSAEGFRISGMDLAFQQGPLAGKALSIDAALLKFSGELDLYGFSFGSFPLWGYQATLDSLSIGPSGIGFSGGIRLADTLPIPELAGAYLKISSFKVGFNGTVQEFKVSIDQGFSFTVYDSWILSINGLEIDQSLLTINHAELQLPAGFQLGTLSVSGMSLDLVTGDIHWGEVAVGNAQYTWNDIVFTLNKLKVSQTKGLEFGGTAKIPAKPEYPEVLRNADLTVRTLQILPSGLPGLIDAVAEHLDGPLIDGSLVVTNASIGLANTSGELVVVFSGGAMLGDKFPFGLATQSLQVNELAFNVPRLRFDALDLSATRDFGTVPLFGTTNFKPTSLRVAKKSDGTIELGVAGKFLTGNLPGALGNREIAVQEFRINTEGIILALKAELALADNTSVVDGLMATSTKISVLYDTNASVKSRFKVQGKLTAGNGFMAGLRGSVLDIRNLEWSGSGNLIDLNVGTSWTGSKSFFGGSAVENGSISLAGAGTSPWTVGIKGVFVLPSGIPQGLAGQKINIGTLVFTTAGALLDVNLSLTGLNIDLFGVARLSGGSLVFVKFDDEAFRIDLKGTMALPPGMGVGLANLPVNLQEFAFTTRGQILALKGSVGSPATFDVFAGIKAKTGAFTFSQSGVQMSGTISIPTTMVENLPGEIGINNLLVGWNGALNDLEAVIDQYSVRLGGFSTFIRNLVVSEDGVTIASAVLTLPPNMGGKTISITNAGFTKSGGFTGTVGISEIKQDIAGFGLTLQNLSLNIGARELRIQRAMIQAPEFAMGSKIELTGTVIRPSGLSFGGAGFDLPNFDYNVVKFRSIHLGFGSDGTRFRIEGKGEGEIPYMGILNADLAFTNPSSTYPIGLEHAQFTYTLAGDGLQIGTTGMYLTQITGGIWYGPALEVPIRVRYLFANSPARLNLGVNFASKGNVITMTPKFWVDMGGGAFAFSGDAKVMSMVSGQLSFGYGNNIAYGGFTFTLPVVEGGVEIWIFPYEGQTVLSGAGKLDFILRSGTIARWNYYTPYLFGWDEHHVDIPWGDVRFGGIGAEFGRFKQGSGVKGWVDVPCWGTVGVFVDGGGMHYNIGDYTLVKPADAP